MSVSKKTEIPQPNGRLAAAMAYAALVHGAQVRKGTTIPYVSHLMSVSALVMEFGGDEDQAIAGLLHDALEDCGAEHEKVIRINFGERVAELVLACTDGIHDKNGVKPLWKPRKTAYLERLKGESAHLLLVSACDKLHNARTIVADVRTHGDVVYSRFKGGREGTLWYYGELVSIFQSRLASSYPNVVRELDTVVSEMYGLAKVQRSSIRI